MKNKLIILFVVIAIFSILILIINKNRNNRERVLIEEKLILAGQQFTKDSLQDIQDSLGNIRIANKRTNVPETKITTIKNGQGISNVAQENFSSYLNSSIANSNNIDIAVTILDESGNISSSISSSIASIYSQTGKNGKSGLIRSSFINKPAFQDLMEGNSKIIQNLNLINYTDFIAIGKIQYTQQKGTLVDGTFVCTATITVNIISANQKNLVKSFTCTANGNGATESQAKEYALDKLLSKYKSEHSSL